MRIKKAIRNSAVSVASYLYLFIFGIAVRKAFLENFTLEYLGYEGLFGSIFLVLSIAELGAGGMFNHMLYSALAKNDKKELCILMGMYKKLYRIIGSFVFCAGCVLFLFLPYIITENVTDWAYVRLIYMIQLFTTLVTYFLAYRRAIFVADQQSYEIVRVDTFYKTICSFGRLFVIIYFKNYAGYLLVPFVTNIMNNVHIYFMSMKSYPDLFHYKASVRDFQKRNAFSELKSLLITKISTVLYTSSDNIIISGISGISTVGLYSNYNQLYNFGVQTVWNAISPLNESTGNMLHSETKEKSWNFFEAYDMFSYLSGAIGMSIIVNTFQSIISFLYGKEYLISVFAVLALAEDFYVRQRGAVYNSFQNAAGHFETVKKYSAASAALNIFFSIYLGMKWGLPGILAATVLGNIFIQAGRAHVVYKWIFKQKTSCILRKEMVFAILANVCLGITFFITAGLNNHISGIILRLMVSVFIPVSICCLVFQKSNKYLQMKFYFTTAFKEIMTKIIHRGN